MPSQPFNTWVKPLQAQEQELHLQLLAPNKFFKNWVEDKYLSRIQELSREQFGSTMRVSLDINQTQKTKPSFLTAASTANEDQSVAAFDVSATVLEEASPVTG